MGTLACAVISCAVTRLAWAESQDESPPGANGAPPARPTESAPRFGSAGQLVVSSALSLEIGRSNRSDNGTTSFTIAARPSASIFVWENVSIGGTLLFQYRDFSTRYVFPPQTYDPNAISSFTVDSSALMYGIGVGVGVNVPMGDWVSFWPRGFGGVWTESITQSPVPRAFSLSRDGITLPQGDYRETAVWFEIYAPLLIHPAPHFFVGFGPDFFIDLVHDVGPSQNRRVYWGATSLVGGWL